MNKVKDFIKKHILVITGIVEVVTAVWLLVIGIICVGFLYSNPIILAIGIVSLILSAIKVIIWKIEY